MSDQEQSDSQNVNKQTDQDQVEQENYFKQAIPQVLRDNQQSKHSEKNQESYSDDEEQNKKEKKKRRRNSKKQKKNEEKQEEVVENDKKKKKQNLQVNEEQQENQDQSLSVDRSNVHEMSSSKILQEKKPKKKDEDEVGIQGFNKKQSKENDQNDLQTNPSDEFKKRQSKILKPISFFDIICFTYISYNKLTSMLYLDAPYMYRALKVLSTITQLYIILALSGLFTVEIGDLGEGPKILILILLMRPIQILFMIIFSRNISKSRALYKNTFATMFSFVIIALCHYISFHYSKNQYTSKLDDWKKTFIIVFCIEIFAIDFIALPFAISLYIKCSKTSRYHLSPVFRQS